MSQKNVIDVTLNMIWITSSQTVLAFKRAEFICDQALPEISPSWEVVFFAFARQNPDTLAAIQVVFLASLLGSISQRTTQPAISRCFASEAPVGVEPMMTDL